MELVVIIKSITTATENKKEENKIQNQLQNKSKDTNNNKYFSWISAVSILSFAVSQSPRHLLRMPSNTGLVSGPAVGAAQTLIWLFSCMFLPPMSTGVRTRAFSFMGTLCPFIYSIDRICLVYQVDLISSLYSCGEVFDPLP